ncbi:MAG TPA: hypothetical protein VFR42_02005 [Candidatus Acidoferrum sp.]|nr:hypothetical protein [Candidatus Acidoferrum sp.]
MNISCNDRERIFLDGTEEEWAALEVHAATCVACREEMNAWKSLSVVASELHEEWDSPTLWPRIERALAKQSTSSQWSWWGRFFSGWNVSSLQWQTAAASLVLVAVTSSAVWFVMKSRGTVDSPTPTLLKDEAVRSVERAEAVYEQAIDKLDLQARAQLENASTPLMASYREKLQVLDSAIADLKLQAGVNPANGHLRRQLLAMYQEKQSTLEEVLEAKPQ